MTKDEALDLAQGYLDRLIRGLNMDDTSEAVQVRDAIKQARALDEKAENARELGLDYEPVCNKDPQGCWNVRCQLGKKCKNTPAQQEPVQSAERGEPVDTLIAAWQALEETSGHVLDVGDVEGRMHMSVIRSAWEQMDSLVREIWDERGRP